MFRVTRDIHFCYGHRLMDYAGKCRHPHGHNGKVEVELSSDRLNALGMVRDFEDIKSALQSWIDETLDHRMILRKDDPLVPVLKEMGAPVHLLEDNPTAENIAKAIFDQGVRQSLPITQVRLWETPASCAAYSGGVPR